MKKMLLILAALSTPVLAAPAPKAPPLPKACIPLDKETGFQRCETIEVICYVSKGGQQCWPKPTPSPAPSPLPTAQAEK